MRSSFRVSPHLALLAGAAGVLAAEAGYQTWTSDLWLFLEGALALAALLVAWREQERLRLPTVLALALGFQVGLIAIHLAIGATADVDSSVVYRLQGEALLDGDYPRSEYPTGAVLLFALEALVGGGDTRVANAFLMIPFQLLLVAAIWALRTRWSAWLAVAVALWPANAYFWEFKFDLVPAALLAAGLVLALRERWGLSGAVLGLGAAVKWTPGLAFLALAVWLVASERRRAAGRHALWFGFVLVVVHLPFLLWSPRDVAAAYTRQGGREITPESLWYLLLRPFDLAQVRTHLSFSAGAPEWADVAATLVQAALVVAVLVLAVRARTNLRAAVAISALVPAVFLLTNRIFSPQFLVPLFAAWAVAGALVAASRRQQLALGLAVMAAAGANAFVYPFALPSYDVTWPIASAILFALALAVTGLLLVRAAALGPEPASEHDRRGQCQDHEGVEVVEDHRQVEEVRGHRSHEGGRQAPGQGAQAGRERVPGGCQRTADRASGA
jgi:hypothetical protein